MTTSQTPEQLLATLEPTELGEYMAMYQESFTLSDEERKAHLETVAELVGSMEIYNALIVKANQDIAAAEQVAEDMKRGRAQSAATEIDQHGFAKVAPRLVDQVIDETRTNRFLYVDSEDRKNPDPDDIKEMSEAEGLQQLYEFLADFYNDTRNERGVDQFTELSARAHSMLENLSFIGEREFQEAAYGIAAYWKNYLDEDEERQICVLAPVSHSTRFTDARKSDDYFRDRVLQTLNAEELEKYSGRIVGYIDDMTAEPDAAKVILLDDWSISGRELRTSFDEQLEDDKFYEYLAAGAVEINLLIASQGRLNKGLRLNPNHDADVPNNLPVRSYFQSRHSAESKQEHRGHVSGTHSSVNYDFDKDIGSTFPRAAKRFNSGHRLTSIKECASRVALANVVPPYRESEPVVELTADSLYRVEQETK